MPKKRNPHARNVFMVDMQVVSHIFYASTYIKVVFAGMVQGYYVVALQKRIRRGWLLASTNTT
jgi:cytochrome b subunit of formate dehydrogenase